MQGCILACRDASLHEQLITTSLRLFPATRLRNPDLFTYALDGPGLMVYTGVKVEQDGGCGAGYAVFDDCG
jgi:hypothetical protein